MEDALLSRRSFVKVAGAAAGSIAASASAASAADVAGWDREVDIVCVGSGAAALTAAIIALDNGDSVAILEKRATPGGTTSKSGGIHWIPNNFLLRKAGIADRREDALAYMARYAFPADYTPDHPTLGLPQKGYDLLATYYDTATVAVDRLLALNVYKAQWFDMIEAARRYHPGSPETRLTLPEYPDYFDHAAENKVKNGRALVPQRREGGFGYGSDLVDYFVSYLAGRNQPIMTGHQVLDVARNGKGEVIGVVTAHEGRTLRIRARKAVIFGTGGYAQNEEMKRRFQPTQIYGSCAVGGAQGDIIPIATRAGAALGNMASAWRGQVILEEALAGPVGTLMFFSVGDSMFYVNKYGRRMVDEWRSYHSRGLSHHLWDSTREEFTNELAFVIFDQRVVDLYGGIHPIPNPEINPAWTIKGDTLPELAANIAARLERLRAQSVDVRLSPDFADNLRKTMQRFNGFARNGIDEDFDRGGPGFDMENFLCWSQPRDTAAAAGRKSMKNPTMYPLSENGPYYCTIVAEGVLDTNGGPVINTRAQIIDYDDRPIPGLYGAGNCVASPSRHAYFAGGNTIGMAITSGYIAATAAHLEPMKQA